MVVGKQASIMFDTILHLQFLFCTMFEGFFNYGRKSQYHSDHYQIDWLVVSMMQGDLFQNSLCAYSVIIDNTKRYVQ